METASRGLLVGMVLGDGCISCTDVPNKDGTHYTNSILQIWHSVKQLDYCQYKLDLIKGIKPNKANINYRECKLSNGKSYRLCGFGVSSPYFKTLRAMMYPGGKKRITQQALNMLTPQGIALWFMDDGYGIGHKNKDGWISSATVSIATMCSREEVDLVIDYFAKIHGVHFKPRFKKRISEDRGWFVEGNTACSKELAGLIGQYIIPSMMYKIAFAAGLNLHECLAPESFVCVECGSLENKYTNQLCRNCYNRSRHHANLEESRLYNKLKSARLREHKRQVKI